MAEPRFCAGWFCPIIYRARVLQQAHSKQSRASRRRCRPSLIARRSADEDLLRFLGLALLVAGTTSYRPAVAVLAMTSLTMVRSFGTISVATAVSLDCRTLKCGCVGGSSKVPVGFVSLTENLFMLGVTIWIKVQ